MAQQRRAVGPRRLNQQPGGVQLVAAEQPPQNRPLEILLEIDAGAKLQAAPRFQKTAGLAGLLLPGGNLQHIRDRRQFPSALASQHGADKPGKSVSNLIELQQAGRLGKPVQRTV